MSCSVEHLLFSRSISSNWFDVTHLQPTRRGRRNARWHGNNHCGDPHSAKKFFFFEKRKKKCQISHILRHLERHKSRTFQKLILCFSPTLMHNKCMQMSVRVRRMGEDNLHPLMNEENCRKNKQILVFLTAWLSRVREQMVCGVWIFFCWDLCLFIVQQNRVSRDYLCSTWTPRMTWTVLEERHPVPNVRDWRTKEREKLSRWTKYIWIIHAHTCAQTVNKTAEDQGDRATMLQ